jgi:hypothetical protein
MLLMHVHAEDTQVVDTCSRPVSRHVKELIARLYIPETYSLPENCPFHPANDMFAEQEALKGRVKSQNWQCQLEDCGKIFKTEHYLDRHMSSKHTLDGTKGVCLADYCGILQCRGSVESVYNTYGQHQTAPVSLGGHANQCSDAEMSEQKALCTHVIHKCFPPSDGDSLAHDLHNRYIRSLCNVLTCEAVAAAKITPNSDTEWNALYYVAVGLMLILVLLFYVFMTSQYYENKQSKDLIRVRKRHKTRVSWLQGFLNSTPSKKRI